MRQVSILFVLLLSFVVSGFAQERKLTIDNIRLYSLAVGGDQVTKVIQIDETSIDVYTKNGNLVHVQLVPCEPVADYSDEELVTLGMVIVTSEKKLVTHSVLAITFNLTDGDVTYPCYYSPGGEFRFLHRASNEEVIFKKDTQLNKIRLRSEGQRMVGTAVAAPIQAIVTRLLGREGSSRKARQTNTKREP